jgi:large subunit ribosomal protein L16
MLMPKRVKYRKQQRGRVRGWATRGNRVAFGDYGLQALEPGWIKAQALEASRIAVTHLIKGHGRIYMRVFPHKPVTARPPETRMGKGKGNPEFWVAVVRPGQIICELAGVSEEVARECLARVAHKLPVKVRLVKRSMELV